MRALTLFAALCITVLTTACGSVDSAAVPTSEMRADIEVVSRGSGATEVVASLRPKDSTFTFVNLVDGETLFAHAAGRDVPLTSEGFDYRAHLPTDIGNLEVQVRFERVHDRHAPDSFVEMPASFELYPFRGVYAPDYEAIPIAWSRVSNDEMRVTVEGSCIADFERLIAPGADDGVFVLHPGALHVYDGWYGETCEVEVTLERQRIGRLDPAFGAGNIAGVQRRVTHLLLEL